MLPLPLMPLLPVAPVCELPDEVALCFLAFFFLVWVLVVDEVPVPWSPAWVPLAPLCMLPEVLPVAL
jgi:hypothetical protein